MSVDQDQTRPKIISMEKTPDWVGNSLLNRSLSNNSAPSERPETSYVPEIHLYDRPLPLGAELRKQLGRAKRAIMTVFRRS